ncbi:hypothetical protein TL16_g01148 [Triparma laevis f. inornata]|uniref:Uncharacterized protein n=1 Tax=Triparma laevis f. inornata TaxID=1714386 RepID=A0A9W6ZCS8_9STRA|nr:hypothetical protein TL16_g01148 [Triparma laevis f. inornata]
MTRLLLLLLLLSPTATNAFLPSTPQTASPTRKLTFLPSTPPSSSNINDPTNPKVDADGYTLYTDPETNETSRGACKFKID